MYDYEFRVTDEGVVGVLPDGEERLFATESEYDEAYQDSADQIADGWAEAFGDRVIDFPEEWDFLPGGCCDADS